jgi:hypothetical protein
MVQARGWLAQVTSFAILLLSGGTLIFLLVIVVDSALIGNRLVTYLSRKAKEWPQKLVTEEARERGFPSGAGNNAVDWKTQEAIEYWLKIRLVNETTLAVARLIYRPFIILLILIIAQNQLFDNWHWNIPLSVIALLSAGTAVGSAWLLQRKARSAKQDTLDALGTIASRRISGSPDDYREKVERIRHDVEDMRSGAFASFWQNPVVRAVLLPLGGGGGLAALEAVLPLLR